MALSVVDLYRDVLPKTNCGDCGYPTCLAFAGMVVSEQLSLAGCPHLDPAVVERCNQELGAQYAAGKWTKRDLAEDALQWARERSASMALSDLPQRIGGRLVDADGVPALELPYYTGRVIIRDDDITRADGESLTRWEKVFIYNHMAQGGQRMPTGKWKGFEEFPNTVSKVKTMAKQVEVPLAARFQHRPAELKTAAIRLGGEEVTGQGNTADVAFLFHPFPRVPVTLLFWDEDPVDGFAATVKLLFDETVIEHLDIESIVFLSERLRQLLEDTDEKET